MPERRFSTFLGHTSAAGERRNLVWFALFASILVFIGFSRTYFLHRLFHTPDLSLFLHFHAAVMTGWMVLFVLQTFLIKGRKTALHRKFGYFGCGYALLVVIMGSSATVLSARREVRAASPDMPGFLVVLALELTQMALFAGLVALAVYARKRPASHKRFMVLATLCMLPNPLVRLLVPLGMTQNIQILMFWAGCVIVVVGVDALRQGKLQSTFAVGAPAIIGCLSAAYLIGKTSFWQAAAARVVK